MERYQFSETELMLLEQLPTPIAVYQTVGNKVYTLALSDGFRKLFGYNDKAEAYRLMNLDPCYNTHPDDTARIEEAIRKFSTEGGQYEVIFRAKDSKGKDYRVVHGIGNHIYRDGMRLAVVSFTDEGAYTFEEDARASTLNKAFSQALHEESLLKANYFDDLTGLPSMTHFFSLAEEEREKTRNEGGNPVMLYMNFSGMKFYNMKNGFAEGNNLLQAFAKTLSGIFGSHNCCRISADHFVVLTEEQGLVERIKQLIEECQKINGGNTLPVHVGVYVAEPMLVPVSVACDRAKLACSKLTGRYETAVNYYSKALSEEASSKQYIIENIDRAIKEKWIKVYLQPIIRAVNGRVCDVEALARWIDPVKGILSPASFIPVLEEAGLIYKLDLYMVDEVLELIKAQMAKGFFITPHSVNLSRSDFDTCDIVEEIRQRVDDAGIARDRITIEITESIIGSDFEFMKTQVERFQKLGFPVWMDDFGSGYSSLDVLQSIRFDLLKFDMSFMNKLNEGDSGKIILTELMKMATSLGMDTVCEGVETEAQVRFLQEIGCSKLQGYYYSKPLSFDAILEMYEKGILIENENPEESVYYESLGRLDLFDLSMVGSDDEDVFEHTFSSIPIAVLEVNNGQGRYVRSNGSYRYFAKRFFNIDVMEQWLDFDDPEIAQWATFLSSVKQCCVTGHHIFFDEKVTDGSVFHFFARRVSINPLTGTTAVAIAVLSIAEPDEESMTFAEIARSLAADYYNIYLIDLDTNDYIEYSSQVGSEEMLLQRHGGDFFESAKRDTMVRIYEEDRESFLTLFTKENVLRDIDRQGVFTTTYRLVDTGAPMYVNMKITRMHDGNRLILGVSIIDAYMKQQEEEKRLKQEKVSLGRIAALSPDYMVLYTVDPVTGHYTQYNPSNEFEEFGLASQGEDFFADVVLDAPKAISQEDMERHLRVMTKENMLRDIRNTGFFIHHYRMLIDGKTVPASLRATLIQESDGEKIILGVTNDAEEYRRKLEAAYKEASSNATIYNHIAHALARGCTDLFYVNTETNELIEFNTDDASGVLSEARRGMDFFEGCERDARLFIHPDDQDAFIRAMNRDFLSKALDHSKVFEMTYRRIKEGRTFFVDMKVSRMEDDPRIIVIAVSDIDELMKQRRLEERIQEERIVYARLHAITGNFIVVYVVDPVSNHYREFSATLGYAKSFGTAKEGLDFFESVRRDAKVYAHPKDLDRFLAAFSKESILEEIRRSGIFTWGYRIMMGDKPIHVQMKAAMVEEKEGPRLIVGLNDIDAQVRQEEEYSRRLAKAQSEANIDGLTGIKNRHAYLETVVQIDQKIEDHEQPPFAVVILDVNDLKKINDTNGHQAGDQYLRDACKIICTIFKHSPVFRVGGDEFAVISQGRDYADIHSLVEKVRTHNMEALHSEGIVIACGMARFENDENVAAVVARADHNMYENKAFLKR